MVIENYRVRLASLGQPRPVAASAAASARPLLQRDGQPKSAICQERTGGTSDTSKARLVIGEMLTALVISWTSINLILLDRTFGRT